MRASTKVLLAIERVLTSPGWTYCALWHYPPFAPVPRRHQVLN